MRRDSLHAIMQRVKKGRLIAGVVSVVVIAGVFLFVLPRIADYRAVWDTIQQLTWQQVLVLAIAEIVNLATFAPPYMSALPGLGYWRASVISQASTASTYVAPGGAAVGMGLAFAMLRGWGFAAGAVTLAVTLTGVWNQLFMLGAPAVALALLTHAGGSNTTLKLVALIGLVVFVLAVAAFVAALASNDLARWVGDTSARLADFGLKLIKRGPVGWNGESLVRFREQTVGLLRRRWLPLTLATCAGQLSVFAVMVVCLRTLGVHESQVTLTEAFAAWTFVRLLGSLPITPGGVGIVELGLTGALVGFGGPNDGVVAAVLLYRVITVVPTLVLGLVAGALWKRLRPELHAEAVAAAQAAAVEQPLRNVT
ncbi:MAG TPA: YbhN family protein [Gaiellaceae bacterium]|nr:YbhN family protein [Gaiellaceae bacterium]